MDLVKVLGQLREELANLDAAISSLERLQYESGPRRRGRPPKSISATRKAGPSDPPEEHEPPPEPSAPSDLTGDA